MLLSAGTVVGVLANLLVVLAVAVDKHMRESPMFLLLANLVSDYLALSRHLCSISYNKTEMSTQKPTFEKSALCEHNVWTSVAGLLKNQWVW